MKQLSLNHVCKIGLREMKNCNKGKSGKRDFLDHCLAERACIFSAKDVAKNVRERAKTGKEKQKGLIAKIYANNLYQRKLF